MKKLIIMLLLVTKLFLCSQDYEPAQARFNYMGNDTLIDVSKMSDFISTERFIKGLHWGNSKLYMKNMNMTNAHFFSTEHNSILDTNGYPNNVNLTLNAFKLADWYDYKTSNGWQNPDFDWNDQYFMPDDVLWKRYNYPPAAIGIQFEPTLLIDTNNVNNFSAKANDSTNSIFGFGQIEGIIPNTPSDINFDRLLLYPSLLTGNTPKVVLAKNWMSDAMENSQEEGTDIKLKQDTSIIKTKMLVYRNIFFRDTSTTTNKHLEDSIKYNEINGDKFYLSLNLRALSNNAAATETLLGIRLRYICIDTNVTGYIKFDSIPKVTIDTLHLKYNRGVVQKLDSSVNRLPDTLLIKKSMLQYYSLSRPDITLSAHFSLLDPININPFLKNKLDKKNHSQLIDKMEIEVIYYGKDSLAIDWIRLETKHAQFVHRGYYDSIMTTTMQIVLDTMTQSTRITSKNIKLKGIYIKDEPHPKHWSQMHHVTKLLGNICTFEGDMNYWNHQKHYFNKEIGWAIQNHCQNWQAYPYNNLRTSIYGLDNVFSLGYEQGYTNQLYSPYDTSISNKTIFNKIINSDYETYLTNSDIKTFIDTAKQWDLWSPQHGSFQTLFQYRTNHNYADSNYNSFLFNGNRWWSQTNLEQYWINYYHPPKLDVNDTIIRDSIGKVVYDTTKSLLTLSRDIGRALTGEEMRMFISQSLLMGCKGLIFDGSFSNKVNGGVSVIRMKHGDDYDNNNSLLNSLNPEEYMYSDSIGNDFLVDTMYYEWTNLNKYVNFKQYEKATKTSRERIYLGRKSVRTTVFKTLRWVDQNEDLLLRLQLQSWFGKGFKYTYSQGQNVRRLNTIIDTANIRTRKLFYIADTTTGSPFVKYTYKDNPKDNYESIDSNHHWSQDSSFFDVTIHKDTNFSIDSIFYVGVLNRRTDPLVLSTQNDGINDFQNFYFASSAEYDEGVKSGKNVYHFNNISTTIEEFKDTNYWRDMWWKRNGAREITIPFKYRHPTDTNNYRLLEIEEIADTSTSARNIRNWTNTTVVKTVIGQDGLVKLKMLPGEGKLLKVRVIQPSNNLDGILDYSNQNKLICMKSLADTSKIRYYATYYKHDTINNIPINRVYFASSQTISKEAPTEQIQWNQPPILLNEYIEPPIGGSLIADRSCDYPSIVSKVINDSLINHYLVFQCKGEITNLSTFIEEIIVKTIRKTTPLGIREFDTLMTNNSTYLGNAYYQDNFSRGVTYKDYGNPVISAIDSGVVVAWSSSEVTSDPNLPSKILIRYHDDDGINSDVKQLTIDHNSLLPQFNGTNSLLTDFRHPSMNSYSLNSSFSYRNYSTLVWQQINPDDITNSYISMTHIKLDGGNLVKYLPRISDSYFYNLNNTSLLGFGNDTSIIQFRWGARAGNLPAVYKTYGGFASSRDYIVWERHWSDDYVQLYGVCINNFIQTNPAYSFLRINQGLQLSHSVTTGNRRLSLPNMGTPSELLIGNFNYIYNGNSANLNFNYNDKMLHTSFLGNTIIGNTLVGIDDQYIADKFNEIATGIYSHLSNSPFNNTYGNTWRNRRIFNDPAKIIKTSSRYFYKTNNGGTEINKFVGFANDTSKFSFCDVFQNGNYLNLNTNSTYDTTFQETDYSSSDSIYSDWFTVGTSCNVEFIYKAVNYSGNYHVYIQRRDSNSNTTLTMVPTSDNSRHVLLNLINGNGHEYRLCVQSISNAKYLDEVVFGSLNGDTLFLKGSKQDTRTISLSQGQNIVSKAYPNPASEELFVEINKSYDRVREMTLELYDQVGKLYQLKTCRSGEKVKLDIQNYPKGSYYLNLKGYLDGSETSETIKFEVVR